MDVLSPFIRPLSFWLTLSWRILSTPYVQELLQLWWISSKENLRETIVAGVLQAGYYSCCSATRTHHAFSALTLLVGRQEGHPACKNLELWGAGVVICLERGADLHMVQRMPLPLTVSCFSKIQIGFTFLVPAYPGSPGLRAIKRVCVCVAQPPVRALKGICYSFHEKNSR